jgi:hypothetical protein
VRALTFGAIGAAAAFVFVASGIPALGADNGTVAVSVTPKVACLTVAPPTVNLGNQSFSDPVNTSKVVAQTRPSIGLCGPNEKVLVHGTDATSSASKWTLSGAAGDPCAEGRNVLHELVVNVGVPTTQQHEIRLTTADSLLYPAPNQGAVSSFPVELEVEMPCGGSDGAGVANTFSYVFTATA